MRRRTQVFALAAAFSLGVFAQRAFAEEGKMESALIHLRYALGSLNQSTNDRGGHREKAVKLVLEAIDEAKAAIALEAKAQGKDAQKP